MIETSKSDIIDIMMIHEGHPDALTQEIGPDRRLRALVKIVAINARRWESVVGFRDKVLEGRVLSQAELADWLMEQWKRDGPPSTARGRPSASALELPPGVQLPELEWELPRPRSSPRPHRGARRVLLVRLGGVLDELARIATHLAWSFPWEEGQAVEFVLTDAEPHLPAGKCTVSFLANSPQRPSHITLELDPQTRVADVAALFKRARRQTLSGERRRFRRYKTVSERHATLAVFLEKTPGRSWQKRMEEWNEQYPKWRYNPAHRPRFRSEAVAAYQRVTGRTWRQR